MTARRDLADLVLLAAVWGASFLLMRLASPAFGAFALIELRVGIAALVLLPVLAWQGGLAVARERSAALAFVGFTNSALPFTLYAWALTTLPAGFAAVANASSPLWAALVAFLWLRDRLSAAAVAGLVLGFAGVAVLSWDKASFDAGGAGWPVLACIGATLSYGVAANFTKRHLSAVAPLAVATASQFFAAVMLLPFALATWPPRLPGTAVWLAVVALAVVCTGFAYFLYFRLIARIGPARAISVTFLVPLFGMLWGAWLGGERITWQMLWGCAIILLGTALANGLIGARGRRSVETRRR
ncbi:MAG: DMT family transporter [Rhodocyclaceae bacterium]|nr:DMT family transporter [Rhodocyclaceae bacterium]